MTQAGEIGHKLRLWAKDKPHEIRWKVAILTGHIALHVQAPRPIIKTMIEREMADLRAA